MRMLGNIIWHFPFFGFLTALFTFLLGLIFTLLVVSAPLGLGLIQYSKFLLAPYSYAMVSESDLNTNVNPLWKAFSTVIMILYLPIGILVSLVAVLQIACLFFSIIGIPVAIPLARTLGVLLNPVGKVCVPIAVSAAMQARREQEQVNAYMNR